MKIIRLCWYGFPANQTLSSVFTIFGYIIDTSDWRSFYPKNDTYFIYLFFILAFLTSFGHCYPMHTPKIIWSVLQFDVVHLWTAQRSWHWSGVWVCCQMSEFYSLLCPSLVTTSQVLDLWHAYYHTFDVHIFYQA